MTPKISVESHSPEETQAFAHRLGEHMAGGEVLALQGDLGAGKTCFVQGLAEGLDVPPSVYVRSPTFTLMDEYPGRMTLFHLDLYRLADIDELEAIGWRECLNGDAVVAVEWANRLEHFLPDNHLELTLEHLENDNRRITLEVHGTPPDWWAQWLSTPDSGLQKS